ncbi:TonB-dependent receptor [Emcibacter sp. SYSU 3D8]|uniref:TonB-dependent receptor n=1 Tax=Emcibacter sp. SYSU 3D8 TaxID=3133969 RepID=UPI0031FF15D1
MSNAPSITLVALVCAVLNAPATLAQEAGPADTAPDAAGDTVVVTATRTVLPPNALPMTIDVIDAVTLEQQVLISGSIIDAVSALSPSFSPTRQKLSGSGETLRGRSPLYAINGIPQSTPIRDGSRDGYTIDPFFIDRVELIYGSNALQGIGATGGVVNQVTVGAPREDGFTGRILLQGTADNGFSGDGLGGKTGALVSWKTGRFDATIGGTYETRGAFYDGKGNRIGVDGTQGEVQDSESWSVFGRLGFQIDDSARLELIANRFELAGDGDYIVVPGDRTMGIPATSMRGKQPGVPPVNQVETVALSFIDDDLAGGNFVAQLFYNHSEDVFGGGTFGTFQDASIAPLGTLFDQSANRSRKYGGKFTYERTIAGGLRGTIGFDALFDRTEQVLALTDRAWVPPTEFRSLAPFGQLNLALFDETLRLSGGVRWENVQLKVDDFTTLAFYGARQVSGGSPSFDEPLLNGGVVYEPWKGIRGYVSYAEGYTVADVGRILRGITQENVEIDTFLDINPVVSNNREVGIEVDRGPITASATYFWSSSKNGSLLVLNAGGVYDVQRQRVAIKGLELNLKARTPVPGLEVSVGYAHLRGRTDSDGDDILDIDLDGANISPDRVNLSASYRDGRFSALVQGQIYLARDFQGGDPRNSFDGYTLVDAAVRYETDFGGVSLSIQNLLDRQYITYYSDTTRPTDDTLFFAGRGRTITLAWDYRF